VARDPKKTVLPCAPVPVYTSTPHSAAMEDTAVTSQPQHNSQTPAQQSNYSSTHEAAELPHELTDNVEHLAQLAVNGQGTDPSVCRRES